MKSDTKDAPALEKTIKKRMRKWSPEMVSDPIQESLLKLIADKKKSKKPAKKATSKPSSHQGDKSNVVSIMDALKKSVAKELQSRKTG